MTTAGGLLQSEIRPTPFHDLTGNNSPKACTDVASCADLVLSSPHYPSVTPKDLQEILNRMWQL